MNSDNSILFFKIFRNKFLNKLIFQHLNLINNHYYPRIINIDNYKKLLVNYKYKEYLRSIKIQIDRKDCKNEQKIQEIQQLFNYLRNLPKNIQYVEFINDNNKYNKVTISNEIYQLPEFKYLTNSIKFLKIDSKYSFSLNSNKIEEVQHDEEEEQEENKEEKEINYSDEYLHLPNNLQYLEIGSHFHKTIDKNFFNNNCFNSITTLKFNGGYRFPLNVDIKLPESIKNLDLSNVYLSNISNGSILPSKLEHLKLGVYFDQELNQLPETLISLKFNKLSSFNSQFKRLPKNLQLLKLSLSYNHPIPVGLLPQSLLVLKFSKSNEIGYNLPILPNAIPDSVTKIRFSPSFRQDITESNFKNLKNLKKLKFMNTFNSEISNRLPNSLKVLKIDFLFFKPLEQLPIGLKKLKMKYSIYSYGNINKWTKLEEKKKPRIVIKDGDLPNTITYLNLSPQFRYESKNSIPNQLEKYVANKGKYLKWLPESCKELKFCRGFNRPIDQYKIPSSIKTIKFNKVFNNSNQSLDLSNLNNVEKIYFGKTFVQNLILPKNSNNLKTLLFGYSTCSRIHFQFDGITNGLSGSQLQNSPLSKMDIIELPSTILSLSLTGLLKNPVFNKVLPDSLKLLELGSKFDLEIKKDWLPNSLDTLIIRGVPNLSVDSIHDNLKSIYVSSENILFFEKNKSVINSHFSKFKFFNELDYSYNGKKIKHSSYYLQDSQYKIIITDKNLFNKLNKLINNL